MACNACGAPMESGARFCVRCGDGVVPPVPVYAPPVTFVTGSRVEQHLRTLGILWLMYGAMPLAGWLIALPFLTGIFGGMGLLHLHHGWYGFHGWPGLRPALFGAIWIPLVTAILLMMSASSFLVGFALLRRVEWGRGLAIGFGFWALIHPVWGTALGIYTLWVLMPESSGWEYRRGVA